MTRTDDFYSGTTFRWVKNDHECAHDHTTLKAALRWTDPGKRKATYGWPICPVCGAVVVSSEISGSPRCGSVATGVHRTPTASSVGGDDRSSRDGRTHVEG